MYQIYNPTTTATGAAKVLAWVNTIELFGFTILICKEPPQ